MFTEKDFLDYFSEETISIDFVSTQKPEEPKLTFCNIDFVGGRFHCFVDVTG